MRLRHLAFRSSAALVGGLLIPVETLTAQTTSPSTSYGEITAFPQVVAVGASPTLAWSITHPACIEDFISFTPSGMIPIQPLVCDIRILGTEVTTTLPNGALKFYPTISQIKFNGSSNWTALFDGKATDSNVQTQQIIKSVNVVGGQGKVIHLSGRYRANGSFGPLRTTSTGSHIKILTNGETYPSWVPNHSSPLLKEFMKPYMNASNKVKIGPMDVIVLMELTHTSTTDSGYDGQDLVLLLSFRTN